MIFNNYADPNHSWTKIPKKILKELNIENHITGFSYMRGNFAYLEEDQDMTTFLKAAKLKGLIVELKEHWTNRQSKIRNYDHYSFKTF